MGEEELLRMRKRIYNLIAHRLGNPTDAEDLTQVTLIRTWERSTSEGELDCAESWAFHVANNLIIDHARRCARRPTLSLSTMLAGEEMGELADESCDPLHLLLSREIDETLLSMLEGLKPRERAVLRLMMTGLDYPEIAAALSLAHGTVRSRVCRMRQRLQEEIRR